MEYFSPRTERSEAAGLNYGSWTTNNNPTIIYIQSIDMEYFSPRTERSEAAGLNYESWTKKNP